MVEKYEDQIALGLAPRQLDDFIVISLTFASAASVSKEGSLCLKPSPPSLPLYPGSLSYRQTLYSPSMVPIMGLHTCLLRIPHNTYDLTHLPAWSAPLCDFFPHCKERQSSPPFPLVKRWCGVRRTPPHGVPFAFIMLKADSLYCLKFLFVA